MGSLYKDNLLIKNKKEQKKPHTLLYIQFVLFGHYFS